jgi:hypothetical protein
MKIKAVVDAIDFFLHAAEVAQGQTAPVNHNQGGNDMATSPSREH